MKLRQLFLICGVVCLLGCNSSSISESGSDSKSVYQLVSESSVDSSEDSPAMPVIKVKHARAVGQVDANSILADALDQATAGNKNVMLYFVTSNCGWSTKLKSFMESSDALFGDNYVVAKIDLSTDENASLLLNQYKKQGNGGVPWIAILTSSGDLLTTSEGPLGNFAFPVDMIEIKQFVNMIKITSDTPSEAKLVAVQNALIAHSKKTITGQ